MKAKNNRQERVRRLVLEFASSYTKDMHKRGYTFVELIVTVALLTLVAGFLVPTYEQLAAQLQLNTATNQVAEFLRLTEQRTVTEQQIYGVTLTANASTIPQYIYNPNNGNKTSVTTFSLQSLITISTVSFSNNSDIRFLTSGAPNVSGYLILTDTVRNRSRKIQVRPSGEILANTGEF